MAILGTGTAVDPFLLSEPSHIDAIRNDTTAHYQLTSNIDMTGYGAFTPIPEFSGRLEGEGFVISNLYMELGSNALDGFIGDLNGHIKKLKLANMTIADVPNHPRASYIGGLVGYASGSSRIDLCAVEGTMNVTNSIYIGGLFGGNSSSSYISDCSIEMVIKSDSTSNVGGAFGYMHGNSTIRRIVSESSVSGGKKNLLCYADFTGSGFYNLNYIYYNSSKTGSNNSSSTSFVNRTSTQFKSTSSFTGINFTSIWSLENGVAPELRLFMPKAKVETITVKSTLEPLVTTSACVKRVLVNNLTSTQEINQRAYRTLHVSHTVISTVDELFSHVIAIKNANIKTVSVTSTISGLSGKVCRRSVVSRSNWSDVELIDSYAMVELPQTQDKPVYANVFFVVNKSSLQAKENMTTINNKENQSETSVI